jgi:hypothetical protein
MCNWKVFAYTLQREHRTHWAHGITSPRLPRQHHPDQTENDRAHGLPP